MAMTIYHVSGTVPLGRALYIERQADAELLRLCREGAFVYILTARQLGKSSLMVHTAQQLEAEGIRTVKIDLQGVGKPDAADQWYLGLLMLIGDRLYLETDVEEWWQANAYLSRAQRMRNFLCDVLLAEVDTPVVIFVDEIDTTLGLGYTDDFFGVIRSLYNARADAPELDRLSFVLIGVAQPGSLVKDLRRSPFNIGQRLALDDFTPDEARPLAAGLGVAPRQAGQLLTWTLAWTSGHPYLTQLLCREIARRNQEASEALSWSEAAVDQVVEATLFGEQSEQDSNLAFVQKWLTSYVPDNNVAGALRIYRDVHQGKRVVDEEHSTLKSHLKLSGVVRSEQQLFKVRNRIYAEIFDEEWIRDHWPLSWWNELPFGIKITAGIIVALLVVLLVVTAQLVSSSNQRATRAIASNAVALADENLDRALLIGLEANRSTAEPDIRSSLFSVLAKSEPLITFLRGHADKVNVVAYPGDGIIVSGSEDGRIIRWDRATRRPIPPLIQAEHDGPMRMAISRDGKIIASSSLYSHSIQLWDAAGGQPLGPPLQSPQDGVKSLAFSPDGRLLATGGWGEEFPIIVLWDVATHKQLGPVFGGHERAVDALTFSPDGRRLASGHQSSGLVIIWDVDTHQMLGDPIQAHQNTVGAVAFSPDGAMLASGGKDNLVRLWDVDTHQMLGDPLYGHTWWLSGLQFSPDGRRLASSSWDGSVRLWDVALRRPLGEPLKGHNGIALDVAFSPDGATLASAGWDETVILWNTVPPLIDDVQAVAGSALSSDGAIMASGSSNGTITLWDVRGRNLATRLQEGHGSAIRGLAFNPTNSLLASGGEDGAIVLWDVKTGQLLAPLVGSAQPVFSLAFSPDGTILASGGPLGIDLWDVRQRRQIRELPLGSNGMVGLAFSPDGARLVASGYDSIVTLWDVAAYRKIGKLTWDGAGALVRTVAFSPDGRLVAAGGDDHTVQLWDVSTLRPLAPTLKGHGNRVTKVAFSPDGRLLVSGAQDGTLRLWDVQARAPISLLISSNLGGVLGLAFSPDGSALSLAGSDGGSTVWDFSFEKLQSRICRLVGRSLTREEWERYLPTRRYRETCPAE